MMWLVCVITTNKRLQFTVIHVCVNNRARGGRERKEGRGREERGGR